jgi:hypothetical protein
MKKHSGMRPQDIVILLKILALAKPDWQAKQVAQQLHISQSEVSEALQRNKLAGLLSADKKRVYTASLYEFLIYGLKYVFPAEAGSIVRGLPTAHSAEPLVGKIIAEQAFVWPDPQGHARGQAIEPLYRSVPQAAREDQGLYELLALVDTLRVGRAREIRIAREELKKRIIG